MSEAELGRQIAAIASLDEPVRKGLYRYVVARRREVGRDEAARALHISRAWGVFTPKRPAGGGLLGVSSGRRPRRRGRGAGRPAKLYRRSGRALAFTLPPRHYELAGKLLVRAVADAASPATRRALEHAARAAGRRLAAAARPFARARTASTRGLGEALAVLSEYGFEPARTDGPGRALHCPFAALAQECRPLVCGMNLALVRW